MERKIQWPRLCSIPLYEDRGTGALESDQPGDDRESATAHLHAGRTGDCLHLCEAVGITGVPQELNLPPADDTIPFLLGAFGSAGTSVILKTSALDRNATRHYPYL